MILGIIYAVGVVIAFVLLTVYAIKLTELRNSIFKFDIYEVSIPAILFFSIIWPALVIFLFVVVMIELIRGDEE